MQAGRLRDRVTFQRSTVVDDGYGNVTGPREDLFSVWANMRETPGKERVAAGSLESLRTATLRVRASSNTRSLTEADIAVARGGPWNILSIAQADERGDWLDILVETGGAQ